MIKVSSHSGLGVVLSLLLVLAVGQARALHVLTFDTKNPGRNEVAGGLGFSITQVGSNAVPGLDLSLFDVIYVSQTYEEFLLWSMGWNEAALKDFVANGGGLVFGSNAPGLDMKFDLSGGTPPITSQPPVSKDEDLAGFNPTHDVAAVPEPGTLALFGLGAFGLFFIRRRMASRA